MDTPGANHPTTIRARPRADARVARSAWRGFAAVLALAGSEAGAQLLPGLASEESVRAIVQETSVDAAGFPAPDRKVSTWVAGLKSPVSIIFNAAGELLVGEYAASRIVAFASPDKRRVIATGFRPHGLAIGSDGTLYASDLSNNKVVRIGANGT